MTEPTWTMPDEPDERTLATEPEDDDPLSLVGDELPDDPDLASTDPADTGTL